MQPSLPCATDPGSVIPSGSIVQLPVLVSSQFFVARQRSLAQDGNSRVPMDAFSRGQRDRGILFFELLHGSLVPFMNQLTIEFPKFLEHSILFLFAEILHARIKELFIFLKDMLGVKVGKLL